MLRCQSPAIARAKLDDARTASTDVTAAFAATTTASRAVAYAATGLFEVSLNGQQYHCGGIQDASCHLKIWVVPYATRRTRPTCEPAEPGIRAHGWRPV